MRFANAVLLLCVATSSWAQGSAVFRGLVLRDSSLVPIQGAEVAMPSLSKRALTDDQGKFRIEGIPAGSHEVHVRYVGLAPSTLTLEFAAGSVVERELLLRKVAQLDTVSVSAAAIIPSFEENRAIGLGSFLTRAELAKMEDRRMGDIVAQMRGVRIKQGTGGRAWLTGSRRGVTSFKAGGTGRTAALDRKDVNAGAIQGACYSQVYLNEAIVYRGLDGEPLFNINSITPSSIEAIEFYSGPASTPLRYSRMNSDCGVIVIHTRRTP